MELFEYADLIQSDFRANGKPTFADKGNKGRPLKADGAAGILVKGLLSGRFFTTQEAIEYLRAHGKISNSPDKRMREARKYCEANGYEIEEKPRENCVAWGIKRNL